jgi:hypothetical protein
MIAMEMTLAAVNAVMTTPTRAIRYFRYGCQLNGFCGVSPRPRNQTSPQDARHFKTVSLGPHIPLDLPVTNRL